LHEEKGRMAFNQVVEHVGITPVADLLEPDPPRIRDKYPEELTM
jgi:hypothetical protein